MGLGEQLNELDRKVLGAAPVDRAQPAAPYRPATGELAPLGRTLTIRATLYGLGALVLGVHMVLGGNWKVLLGCLVVVIVPSLLVAKLSTNSFPAEFPDAPADALATDKVSRSGRMVFAVVVLVACLADLLLLHGKGEAVLLVIAGLPSMILWAIAAEVSERQEDGFVLASRVKHQGRVGRGMYRVPTGG